jgi:hypothetical protein
MKTGVFTRECGNLRSHALAFVTGHSAIIRKVSGETAERDFNEGMLVFEATTSDALSMGAAILDCQNTYMTYIKGSEPLGD